MNWFKVVLIVWFAIEAIGTVTRVGKEREPLTTGVAATSVAIWGAAVLLVVMA